MEILNLVDIPLSFLLTVGVLLLLYIYSKWNHNFFKTQGIPGPAPYAFIGNRTDMGIMHNLHKWRQIYGEIFGIFLGHEPVYVISDLNMLKEIFVKSFSSFRNRREFLQVGYPLNRSVFFLEDAAWKRVRNIITPTFSSGKLRAMCLSINDCAATLTSNFERRINNEESVNMKEYFGAYTMDVIARTAFSIEVDSQNNLDDPFVSHAKKIFSPHPLRQSFLLLAGFVPFMERILRAVGFSFFPNEINTFFIKTITEMIKQRQTEAGDLSVKHTDFLQLLINSEICDDNGQTREVSDTKTKSNGHLSDKQSFRRLTSDEIVAQGMIFFIAGYETTASTLNFVSFAMATHQDVQEKAYREINDVLGNEEPNIDNVGKLKYLENVLLETLRLYPPVINLLRKAAETITVNDITIPKGSAVFIPTMSIQRDPELFDDPEEFKPERHDEKNNPLTFLSFGYGPRICIGMRLALVEVKIALIHVMRKIKFETSPDTPANMSFVKTLNLLIPQKPNMLKLSPRD